ncbi:MAG: T9SS type A sorting domain-containing protein [Bacteroidota bacterium]
MNHFSARAATGYLTAGRLTVRSLPVGSWAVGWLAVGCLIVAMVLPASAQVFYTEDFEDPNGPGVDYTTTNNINVIDNLSDYFVRTDGSGIDANFGAGYGGVSNSFYWAGEDHDDAGVGGPGFGTLCLEFSVDVTGRNNLFFRGLFAANDASNAYDSGPASDFVRLTWGLDTPAANNGLAFEYFTPDGGTTEFLALDANFDGTGDGAAGVLTGTFAEFGFAIPGTGSTLNLQLCAQSNASSEEWAIDFFRVSEEAPLPVELTAFDVTADEQGAVLRWETASEQDNAGFGVEHFTPATGWTTLAFVEGAGTTSQRQTYRHQVSDLTPGAHRFRLRQLDFDGSHAYSQEVETTIEVPGTLALSAVHPNPFSETAHLHLSVPVEQKVSVDVFDLQGRQVASLFAGHLPANTRHTLRLDASRLTGGLYLIRAQGEAFTATQSVVVMK